MPALRAFFRRACALALGLALAGCDELGEFRTGEGEVFHGRVIGSENIEDPSQPSFIRSGFLATTVLDLTFDPAHAAPVEGESMSPGTITTYVCDADGQSACASDVRSRGHFDRATLEPIPELSHDALGFYELPGGGRLRSYIFGVRFSSGEGLFEIARHAMVFVSLLESGRVELRIVAPSVLGADGSELHPALFGVFSLERARLS
jgi:hypothetical protein